MSPFHRFVCVGLVLLFPRLLLAQRNTPVVEGWRIHASFRTNNDLTEAGNKIYVGSPFAMFSYDELTHETEIISKATGLSDATVKQLEYDAATGTLVVGYDNSNIDLLQNGNIYNIGEILSQVIIGDKSLNNISCYDRKAYISCGFGIVVVDLDEHKLVDSYMNLGTNGATLPIYDIAILGTTIYAGTDNGIYAASVSSGNLSDFHSWQLLQSSTYPSKHLETFNNVLFADKDSTLYVYDGVSSWTIFTGQVSQRIYDLKVSNKKLTVGYQASSVIIDGANQVTTVVLGATAATAGSDGNLYAIVPDQYMLSVPPGGSPIDYIGPAGPQGSTALRMVYSDKNLWVAGGQLSNFLSASGWAPLFSPNKIYRFNNNEWHNYFELNNKVIRSPWDIIDVAIDPETKHAFFASFGAGVLEMNETGAVAVYDTTNSSLQNLNSSFIGYRPLYASGVDFDPDGNLWVSNYGAVNPLSVRTRAGAWYAFPLTTTDISNSYGFVTCDDYGSKWIVSTRGSGLIVFNENKTLSYTQDDQTKVLTDIKQNGFLPSKTVFCVTKDQKGEMWVGTAKGLCIFSNPGNVFNAKADIDAKQIVIKTGLVYSNFLGNEPVYCIRTDAANRKWIGTAHGVWLVSEDGYTVIRNFTSTNSPLPADAVHEVGINNETGEVFFATDKGIASYMGTATEGGDVFGNVVVYPNPVRPEYNGLIVIKGLAGNANVKITDISGNLVYETKANGGTATWNGMNFSGRRAATGVYLVFAATEDGEQTHVSKILFIN